MLTRPISHFQRSILRFRKIDHGEKSGHSDPRIVQTNLEVSRFEPTEIFEISGTSEPFRSSYEFKEEDGATRIVFTFELKEIELVMRPFQKLIRTALQEGAIQTIENIRQLLEEAVAETERVLA